jgi:hypothetical protein
MAHELRRLENVLTTVVIEVNILDLMCDVVWWGRVDGVEGQRCAIQSERTVCVFGFIEKRCLK